MNYAQAEGTPIKSEVRSHVSGGAPPVRAELNSLVEEAVVNLAELAREGAKIECKLADEDLYLSVDGGSVSQALTCLLESGVNPLTHLPKDFPLAMSVVIRTGSAQPETAFLEIRVKAIRASAHCQDTICEDADVATKSMRQGISRAKTILASIGGHMAVDPTFGNPARGLVIRVDLARVVSPPV